jgi:hypothetical protein
MNTRRCRSSKRKRDHLLRCSVRELARSLKAIDRDRALCYSADPTDQASVDREEVILALQKILTFLNSQRIDSEALLRLRHNLHAIYYLDETPAIFTNPRKPGRKSDDDVVKILKGELAGMAYELMHSGMPREQAASWVARNIPDEVACRISSKPPHPSTIKEWMYQYGCNVRIRRALRSAKTPDEFETIITEKVKPKEIEVDFGQIGFLSIMRYGRRCRVTGAPFEFKAMLDDMRQQLISEQKVREILAPILPKN